MANELLTVEHLQKFAENISPYLGVNSNIYSLEEKQIGSWVDGKPVYQKTIYIPTVTLTSHSSYYKYEYDLTDLDIDINISMEGSFYDSLNNARYLFTLNSPNRANELYCRFEDKRLFIFSLSNYSNAGSSRLQDTYITIRYTKTTD